MSTLLRNLNGKKVKIGIKNGMTVQDFCTKYECTPDELRERINQLFTVKDTSRQVWNEILANEKKPKAAKAPVEENVSDAPEVTEEVTKEEVADDILDTLTDEELDVLQAEYSGSLIALEKRYKALWQERDEGRKEYKMVNEDIELLKKEFEAKVHKANKIISRDKELESEMKDVYLEYHEIQAALEAIRARIEELSKIVLCVYGNREIAPFDETVEITLDDAGHDELFGHLREQEEAEDFRPKDVRVVARLIRIVANLGTPVEIIFEDEEVKMAYEVFTKKSA